MIIHFTTVHPRDDSRIRSKEVDSLAEAFGGQVALYVQDGMGDEIDPAHGYPIVDTGPRLPRLRRIVLGGWRMFRAVLRARPAVAHFHDPELLPWAILLRCFGIRIVYDAHEDVPRQMRHNPGLSPIAQRVLPPFVGLAEWFGARVIDGVVAPTTTITERFPMGKTALVRNFPLLQELHTPNSIPMRDRAPEFAYIGGLSEIRNVYGMVEAVAGLAEPGARLRLAGAFAHPDMEKRARAMPEWRSVQFEGWVSREEVAAILADVRAGLVVLKPIEHEMVALPIKLFEYMAAGLPVVASNFPIWREIIDSAGCGIVVNPLDLDEITTAMQWILDNPDEAEAMGARGRQAIERDFNWNVEAANMIEFYQARLGVRAVYQQR